MTCLLRVRRKGGLPSNMLGQADDHVGWSTTILSLHDTNLLFSMSSFVSERIVFEKDASRHTIVPKTFFARSVE